MIKSRLKAVLADRDMTQKELVEITGIRQPTLSALSTGTIKHIPLDVLDRICEALDCQPGDIIKHIPNEESKGTVD